ncbi:hypothetical protein RvY_10899 [Ramazzottius varieornatus]|uniref:Uncharacterized protein n=1 Tax=Ramazzottius varieornatus TaxID=947166 RepID=A0A1D1VGB7_RAMVA|nr:hypothetical protein RvY_10899 [Ramazzottius varieornatus]
MPKGLPRIHRTGPPHDENSSSSTALEDEPYEPEPPIEDTFFNCIFRQNTNNYVVVLDLPLQYKPLT